jgi:hypothetical protein
VTKDQYRPIIAVASLTTIFAIVATQVGVFVAGISVLCLTTGYLNEFYLFRPLIRLVFAPRTLSKTALLVGALALIGDTVLVYEGFAFVLGAVTVGCFLMDAIALQFK